MFTYSEIQFVSFGAESKEIALLGQLLEIRQLKSIF